MNRKRVAEKFAKEAFFRFKTRVKAVILFGSVARGDAKPRSDIDLFIVWNGEKNDGWRKLEDIAFKTLLDTREYLSLKVVTPSELNRMRGNHNHFINEVYTHGIRLV